MIPLFAGFVLPAGIFPAGAYPIEAALLEPWAGRDAQPAQRAPDAGAVSAAIF